VERVFMSTLIVAAIIVVIIALAAIPAAIFAQNTGPVVSGRIEFLAGGKLLHDTGTAVKSPLKDPKVPPGSAIPDNLTEAAALDCSELTVVAEAFDKSKIRVTGKTGVGPDCVYELRLPAVDGEYDISVVQLGLTKTGSGGTKISLKDGSGDIGDSKLKYVKFPSSSGLPSTGKLPSDTKTAKHLIVKAIGSPRVKVTAGDLKSVGFDQKVTGADQKVSGPNKATSAFRAVPSTVDFAVDVSPE
jgi:hypothetical protein